MKKLVKRTNCGSCGGSVLRIILDLGLSPIADAYTTEPGELNTRYPLQLAHCDDCGLVQLLEVVEHKILFGTGYSFYTSASAPLSEYHRQYAEDVVNRYNWSGGRKFVVEIGCNDGDMLRHFTGIGADTLGIDPAQGPANYAMSERNLDVLVQPFTRALGLELHAARGPADIIIANHVLAHVEDVSNVLAGIAELLTYDGVAFIEVQYLPDLLLNNAFDLVYHEHRNFFSLTTLERALAPWNLRVTDAWLTDRQGGSLRVEVRRSKFAVGPFKRVDSLRASELWLSSPGAYDGLQYRTERVKTRLLQLLTDARVVGNVAGYGAPAKATTLLNFCGIVDELEFVIDTTLAKQGRFIPGTDIPIVGPNEGEYEAKTLLLLAWNYAGHIIRKHPEWLQTGGRWIVPIPVPTLI